MFRDVELEAVNTRESRDGRRVIAVIGIDRYRTWQRLSNAVNDARGALRAFTRLGFEPFAGPLYDEAATADAIRSLVTDDLTRLHKNDSLIVFFAGHGHTNIRTFHDGDSVKTGYIIPVDGDLPGGSTARWLRLDSWLSDIARLEVKHILVFLDACHSGVALGSLIKWRGAASRTESFERLSQRRSRRVITSAQDDQRALDGGPMPGHSLFTGCLIEGLNGRLAQHGELVTGSEIGLFLQSRVTSYPQSEQTPDFGALEEDRRGELVIRIVTDEPVEHAELRSHADPAHVSTTADGRVARADPTSATTREPEFVDFEDQTTALAVVADHTAAGRRVDHLKHAPAATHVRDAAAAQAPDTGSGDVRLHPRRLTSRSRGALVLGAILVIAVVILRGAVDLGGGEHAKEQSPGSDARVATPEVSPIRAADPVVTAEPPPDPANPASSDVFSAVARFGFFSITATAKTEIYIDNKEIGQTPLIRLPLVPGPHKVKAVGPRGMTKQINITIYGGRDTDEGTITW